MHWYMSTIEVRPDRVVESLRDMDVTFSLSEAMPSPLLALALVIVPFITYRLYTDRLLF